MTGWWFGTWLDYDFPYIGDVILPTDELIFFRGVGQPPKSPFKFGVRKSLRIIRTAAPNEGFWWCIDAFVWGINPRMASNSKEPHLKLAITIKQKIVSRALNPIIFPYVSWWTHHLPMVFRCLPLRLSRDFLLLYEAWSKKMVHWWDTNPTSWWNAGIVWVISQVSPSFFWGNHWFWATQIAFRNWLKPKASAHRYSKVPKRLWGSNAYSPTHALQQYTIYIYIL